jgi:hypothetical protein
MQSPCTAIAWYARGAKNDAPSSDGVISSHVAPSLLRQTSATKPVPAESRPPVM